MKDYYEINEREIYDDKELCDYCGNRFHENDLMWVYDPSRENIKNRICFDCQEALKLEVW